nr:TIGR03435 family protein [Granulicella sp. L46]
MFQSIGLRRPHAKTLLPTLVFLLTLPSLSQTTTAPPNGDVSSSAVFEVSTVKINHSGSSGSHSEYSNGRFTATNITLENLMQYSAYGVPDARILGGPKWLASERFDIQAEIEPSVAEQVRKLSRDQRKLRMQAAFQQLLADRFHLQVHWDTQELPVYALVVAKNGSKLQLPKKPERGSGTSSGNGLIEGNNLTLPEVAQALTQEASADLGRVVLDKTRIAGRYDITLKWTPDTDSNPTTDSSAIDAGPSLFTAIQEQLGLKLEPSKGPVEVLVVDNVEMPSEN